MVCNRAASARDQGVIAAHSCFTTVSSVASVQRATRNMVNQHPTLMLKFSNYHQNKDAAFIYSLPAERGLKFSDTETHQTKEKTLSGRTSFPTQRGW